MVLKQLGMASVSIQAGVEGFLELEPNSNTRFLSGRTVSTSLHLYFSSIVGCMILKIQVHFLMLVGTFKKFDLRFYKLGISSRKI